MKTLLKITAVVAALLVAALPACSEDRAWSDTRSMQELFEARDGDRTGLWVDLINRMSKDRNVSVAEIGVWKGEFAYEILKNCPNVEKYYLVDPWRHLGDWNKPMNYNDRVFETAYQEMLKLLDFAKDRIVVLRGTTLEVVDQIPDEGLDLVYIDGDHTAKGVVIDLIRLKPKMKKHGVIGGDDYVDNIYHHSDDKFDPTMVKPVVNGFVAAYEVKELFYNSSQFAFFND